jgi:hypothetical protein
MKEAPAVERPWYYKKHGDKYVTNLQGFIKSKDDEVEFLKAQLAALQETMRSPPTSPTAPARPASGFPSPSGAQLEPMARELPPAPAAIREPAQPAEQAPTVTSAAPTGTGADEVMNMIFIPIDLTAAASVASAASAEKEEKKSGRTTASRTASLFEAFEIDAIKLRAKEVLLTAAQDSRTADIKAGVRKLAEQSAAGELSANLNETSNAAASQSMSIERSISSLRADMQETIFKAADDGTLAQILDMGASDSSQDSGMRKKVAGALAEASLSGALPGKLPRDDEDSATIRLAQFQQLPTVGTWLQTRPKR